MRKLALIWLVLLLCACAGLADYVSYYDRVDLGGGYYRYDYEYHNPGGANDLTPNVTSWTLGPIVGLDDPNASAAGAIYWDGGAFDNDNTGVTWTYVGTHDTEPDDTGQEIYGIFQVTVYHPSGHTGQTSFDITSPDDSGLVEAPTPEPATLSLCLIGLGALVVRRRMSTA